MYQLFENQYLLHHKLIGMDCFLEFLKSLIDKIDKSPWIILDQNLSHVSESLFFLTLDLH